jgi:dihydroorotate dehydrogenase (fumarate)
MRIATGTTYLGLKLAHPFVAGASPLAATVDMARRLEDGGAAAVVLHSLFEEQVTVAESNRIHHMDRADDMFARALGHFPAPDAFAMGPDAYLDHIRRVKRALAIPVIASLNGMTTESWAAFASAIEDAGADALELNIYQVTTDVTQSSIAIETDIRNLVTELKRTLRIPVAVKLSPFYTALGHLAHMLDAARVDGLVLFNRFYQPDIDIAAMSLVPQLELSTSAELRLRLRWMAILRGRVACSLALTGGVSSPVDGIKALLAGADVVQVVSAILRNGSRYFTTLREGLVQWMDAQGFSTLSEVRGRLAVGANGQTGIFERAEYLRTLQAWSAAHAGTPVA